MCRFAVASAAAMDALDCGGWVNGGQRSVEGDGLVVCAWVTVMSALAGNGFVGLVAGKRWLAAIMMRAGGWSASGGWRMASGKRWLAAMMMRVSAGKWSASVGWWMASVGWRMECKRRLADGKRWQQ